MKKFYSLAIAALLLMAMTVPASAYVHNWTLDLSGQGGGTYEGVDLLRVSGLGTVTQYYNAKGEAGNGILDDGDMFQLESYMATIQIQDNEGPDPLLDGQFFFYSNDLEGYVYDVVPGGSNPLGLASLSYAYTGGSMGLYWGDVNNVGAATQLMDMNLVYGASDGPLTDKGGNLFSGSTDLIFEFAEAAIGTGIFSREDYGDIEEFIYNTIYKAFLVFDLGNNLIFDEFDNSNPDFFKVGISAGNEVSLVVTPEPSTFLIFGLGLLGLIGFRKRLVK